MKNLRDSVFLLLSFFATVLSIAQVEYFEKNILNFQAAFFVMLTIATLIGVWGVSRLGISFYAYIGIWLLIYLAVWFFYWQFLPDKRTMQELSVQFLLIEIAAALSYNVGQYINQINVLLDDMADEIYPNRTLDLQRATDNINTEITRSRRYNRPLSVLVFQLTQGNKIPEGNIKGVEKELLLHFASAKTGRIINEHARQTDLILKNHDNRFTILCPETDHDASVILGQRIYQAIAEQVDKEVNWSTASFPDESLSFDELLEKALARLSATEPAVLFTEQELSTEIAN
ncbi:MAG: hypothetical protein DRI32_04155 [Chloroflexi bacterium]|nr:MAG: hypothetical protein DRI32_04155 [Chloroflexota bacterium]